MKKAKGKLYIFEGIDNVGKTTLIKGLCNKLCEERIPFSKYDFPGKDTSTLGGLVYHLHHKMYKYKNYEINPTSLQLLHIAAHIDIINSKVLPDLLDGKIVLLDRSWWSTYAYGLADGISKKTIKQIVALEIDAIKKVSIGRIFLVQRIVPNDEYNAEKRSTILNAYNELKDKTADLVEVINNNNDINIVINEVYKKIFANYRYELVNHQLDLFGDEDYKSDKFSKIEDSKFRISVGASTLKPTVMYDTYWKLAAKRQEAFFKRINNDPAPWSDDIILQKYKFTNAYRASDRVSQFLIRNIIYNCNTYSPEDMFFRIILFKLFNKIETWSYLEENLGDITYRNYSFEKYDDLFIQLLTKNEAIYSAAYIMPSGGFYGSEKKHRNNLKLLEMMMKDQVTKKVANIKSLRQLYELLLSYPTLGKFLAFQYSIDINYSELCDFSEMSFVVAGPGAQRGISKCFSSIGKYSEEDVIRIMADKQNEEFNRLNLQFKDLWGRPLQLVDCQNLFCETDKYTRVAFPDTVEIGGRKRIKQLFSPNLKGISYFYPPKWRINPQIERK